MKARGIVLLVFLLIAVLSQRIVTESAVALDSYPLAVGIVGKLDPITSVRALNSTEDMVLAMSCDALFAYKGTNGEIEPRLADGWPSFDPVSSIVTVRLKSGTSLKEPSLFDAVSIADCLSKRIPQGSAVTISPGNEGNSLVFSLGQDLGVFWTLFAFAPIYAFDSAGCLVGAGDPPYRLEKCEVGAYFLEPVSQGPAPVVVRGYADAQSMLSSFTAGELHYVSTDLSRTAAAVKGTYWSSDTPAVTMISYNPSSSVFADHSLRSSASRAIEKPYLVLRTIPGRATAASGLYFQGLQPAESAALLKGAKIRLLVASDKAYSLEMLCAVMVKSWWERLGAQVSIIAATVETDYRIQMAAGSYDALISTGWLQPAFRGLATSIMEGGFLPDALIQTNIDVRSFVDSIKNPISFDNMLSCAMKLEASIFSSGLVLPLVKPTKSELYRPDRFTGWSMQQGQPLIDSFRDFVGISPII